MPSVMEFLIERMENAGLQHVFGVPGDYISDFFKELGTSENITLVNTVDETGAGFAADAYARICGIGCVAVTHNVGAFKLVNVVSAAFAERSPLVIISGAPSTKDVQGYKFQHDIFKNITCASAVLTDANGAGLEIDKAFAALAYYKQPIYLELPVDIANKALNYDVYRQGTPSSPKTLDENLDEAINEITAWIGRAKTPVILAGAEIARFDLGGKLLKFAERANIPVATTLLGKSVVHEKHPLYLGVYQGSFSQSGVQSAVEDSDCVIMLGVMDGDATHRYMPDALQRKNVINSNVECLKIKNHAYKNVGFVDFTHALFKAEFSRKPSAVQTPLSAEIIKFEVKTKTKITTNRLFEKINSILDENMIVVADVGNCLYGAVDLMVHSKHAFIGSPVYTTMGTAIPGALGVGLAKQNMRPIVLVGDGAFQMSCTELSTILSKRLSPIIFVFNNHGYSTGRMTNGGIFNDIPAWDYHKITEVIGGGIGVAVQTEEELESAVSAAVKSDHMYVINVSLDADDNSFILKRMKETKKS